MLAGVWRGVARCGGLCCFSCFVLGGRRRKRERRGGGIKLLGVRKGGGGGLKKNVCVHLCVCGKVIVCVGVGEGEAVLVCMFVSACVARICVARKIM